MSQNHQTVPVTFHYAFCELVAYKEEEGQHHGRLLKNLIEELASLRPEEQIIDRLKKRQGSTRRELLHLGARMEGGNRCYGRLAKIKEKAPFAWDKSKGVEQIDLVDRRYIDITNYLIDFRPKGAPVIMVEYNYDGPRISDVEFFYRQIARKKRIAKSVHLKVVVKLDIKDLTKRVTRVFNLKVKLNASQLHFLKGWSSVKLLKGLKDESAYQDVQLDLSYGYKKEQDGKYTTNFRALDYFRELLGFVSNEENQNLERFDTFKATFLEEGEEEPVSLDFVKNKVTSLLSIALQKESNYLNGNDLRHQMGQEMHHYLTTGTTNG